MNVDWNELTVTPPTVAGKWGRLEDGTHIEISVQETPDEFVVRVVAESRTSGPSETLAGTRRTLEEALALVDEDRKVWEEDEDIDLSKLRSI